MQNGYIERFNRIYKQDVLNPYLFAGIDQVRVLSEKWIEDYNFSRPHEALGGRTPYQVEELFSEKQSHSNQNKVHLYPV